LKRYYGRSAGKPRRAGSGRGGRSGGLAEALEAGKAGYGSTAIGFLASDEYFADAQAAVPGAA
jgi:hypothetical protein